jgi:hypothetical protein
MKFDEWDSKDIKWFIRVIALVIAILVSLVIFVLGFRLGDNKSVVDISSFLSSWISIILGLVAIYVSIKLGISSQDVNTKISSTIERMDEKINNVNDRVKELDIDKITKHLTDIGDNLSSYIDKLNLGDDISLKLKDAIYKETVKKSDCLKEKLDDELKKSKFNFNTKVSRLKKIKSSSLNLIEITLKNSIGKNVVVLKDDGKKNSSKILKSYNIDKGRYLFNVVLEFDDGTILEINKILHTTFKERRTAEIKYKEILLISNDENKDITAIRIID